MNPEADKYSRIEYERRFLVAPDADWRRFVEPHSKTFEDKYLRDSRLRLRILTDSDTNRRLIKLTKKYESDSPYFQQITTIILSPAEYQTLEYLEGNRLRKTRYYHHYQNRVFSIDVFENELDGLLICEVESGSLDDLMSAEPPAYVWREVTEDLFFTGGNLCRMTKADLLNELSVL
jgi:CYTH domain-containing protein